MERKSKRTFSGSFGVGYVTLVMIFAVICLAIPAMMSFQAASANEVLDKKSIAYNHDYYAADSRAKEKLARLDNAALAAAEQGFFSDSFPELCADIEGISLKNTLEGFTADYTEQINERLVISVSVLFYSQPADSGRYRVLTYKTASADIVQEDKPLGVWDGTTLS